MGAGTTRRGALPLLAAAWISVTAAGCERGPVGVPPDPPGVAAVRDDAFPATVRAAERQTREAVAAQLASRFGTDLRILSRGVDSDADPGPIKAHYERALAGWSEFPLLEPPGAWAFAYTSPDGRSVVAVIVLNPRFAPEGGGNVPLTILTNLPGAGGR